jgi:hypothetical protein
VTGFGKTGNIEYSTFNIQHRIEGEPASAADWLSDGLVEVSRVGGQVVEGCWLMVEGQGKAEVQPRG